MYEAKRLLSSTRWLPLFAALATTALTIGLTPGPAEAGCNQIPVLTTQTWHGYRGSIDTVFGHPDNPTTTPDLVKVGIHGCKAATIENGKDYVVTVLFEPPGAGTRNMVALTAKADCSPMSANDCDPKKKNNLHCVCGAKAGIKVNTDNTLEFRFPDTDGLATVTTVGGLTGPATIAVVPYSNFSLPWGLKNSRCQDSGAPSNLAACVDEIFKPGSCSDLNRTYSHFTALPAMNNWKKVCKTSWYEFTKPYCDDEAVEVRLTVDQNGNALLPIRWEGVLKDEDSTSGAAKKKKNREVEGRTDIRKTTDDDAIIIQVPSEAYLTSHMPKGGGWPGNVKFDPDPDDDWLVLSGESDVSESVLRISRRNCIRIANDKPTKTSCTSDTDCDAGQECGTSLFNFDDRLTGGVGPVVIPKPRYEAKAKGYKSKQ